MKWKHLRQKQIRSIFYFVNSFCWWVKDLKKNINKLWSIRGDLKYLLFIVYPSNRNNSINFVNFLSVIWIAMDHKNHHIQSAKSIWSSTVFTIHCVCSSLATVYSIAIVNIFMFDLLITGNFMPVIRILMTRTV